MRNRSLGIRLFYENWNGPRMGAIFPPFTFWVAASRRWRFAGIHVVVDRVFSRYKVHSPWDLLDAEVTW